MILKRLLLSPATLEGGNEIKTEEAKTDVFDNPREPKAPVVVPAPQKQPSTPPKFTDKLMEIEEDEEENALKKTVENVEKKEEIKGKEAPKSPETAKAPEKVKEEEGELEEREGNPPPAPTNLLEGIKPPAPKGTPGATTRDYSKFSQEEQTVLKQMSKQAFEFTAKLLKEKKELEPLRDAHYLQTEDGYMLTPEYKSLAQDAFYAEQEASYLMQCLTQIGEGQKYRPMKGWDKNGQPVFDAEQEPTAAAAERIRVDLQKVSNLAQQAQGKMQVLPQQYKQRIQQDNLLIQKEQEKMFDWVKNPAILESKIPVGNGQEHSIKEIKDNIKNMFPAYHRSNPAVDVASNLFVALKIYAAQITELRGQLEVSNIKKEEAIRSEPKGDNKGGTEKKKPAKGKGSVGVFTIEETD